ncbi:MAG: ABC transporter ATP-binding protein [Sulfobacillus sp.]
MSLAPDLAVSVKDAKKEFWEAPDGGEAGVFTRNKRRVMALDGVSFTVRRGETYGILGTNGSGKSTLIRLMGTLLYPDGGEIRIFGKDPVAEAMAVRRMINRVSVEASFFKKLSAYENLSYAAGLYGVPQSEVHHRAKDILHRLGLSERKLRAPLENMSRGQQQKVAIARALLTSPTLMLLDEPTTGLDPRSKHDVQEFIEEIRLTHDATIVLCTHDMDEAKRLCDRVAVIHHGHFIAEGTPTELTDRYAPGAGLEEAFLALVGATMSDLLEQEEAEL